MLVLDTDTLTLVQRADSREYARLLSRLETSPDQVICATIVSFEEQTRGWLATAARAKTADQLVDVYARLHAHLRDYQTRVVLDFDEQAAQLFLRLVKSKIRVGTMDLRIAAIALTQDATLLSRNLRDFRKVPGLRVEDWTK